MKLRKAHHPKFRLQRNLKYNYGLSLEDYEKMLFLQGYACAICRTKDWRGRGKRPCVDHDHKTGKVRGLLCSNCNTGLGMFNDNYDVLKQALAYIARVKPIYLTRPD